MGATHDPKEFSGLVGGQRASTDGVWIFGPNGERVGANEWWTSANQGIVGLGPAPWGAHPDVTVWPTGGYDDALVEYDFDAEERGEGPLAASGRTREEWLALADEMIQRWTDWRAFIADLP